MLAVLVKPPAALFAWIKSNIGSVGIDCRTFLLCYSNCKCSTIVRWILNETRAVGKLVHSVASYICIYIFIWFRCSVLLPLGEWNARSLAAKKDSDCTGSHSMAKWVLDGSWHRTMKIVSSTTLNKYQNTFNTQKLQRNESTSIEINKYEKKK